MIRSLVSLWLTAGLAAAFDASSILDAKLNTGSGGFPCLLRGAVTMLAGPGEFYLQDETSGVRVTAEPGLLVEGARLETGGWMYLADSGEFQFRARQVRHMAGADPLLPRLIPLPAALEGSYQGQLVAVRGAVLNVDFGSEFDTVSIQSGRNSLRVFYPTSRGRSPFESIYPGMELAVNGISVPQTAGPEFDGYQVRLRSPADLAIRPARATSRSPVGSLPGSLAAMLFVGAGAWIWSDRHYRARASPRVQ